MRYGSKTVPDHAFVAHGYTPLPNQFYNIPDSNRKLPLYIKDIPCDRCARKGLECVHHAPTYGTRTVDKTKVAVFGCLPCRAVRRTCTPKGLFVNALYGMSAEDDGVEGIERRDDSDGSRRARDAGGGEEGEHAKEVDGVDYDDVEDDSVEDDGNYYDDDSHYGSGVDSGDDGEGGNRDDADPASSTRGTKRRMGRRTMEPAKRPKMSPSPAINNARPIAQRSVTPSPDPSTSETERPHSSRIVEHAATSSRTMASDELRIKDLEDKLRSKTKLVQRQMRKISELETSHQRLEIIEEGHRRRIQQLQDENAALSEEANKSKNEAIKAMEHVIKAKDETLRAKDEVLKAKAEVLRDKDPKRSAADDAKGAKMGQLQAELRSFQLRHVWELPSIDDVMSHALEPSHAACPVDVEGVRYQRRPIIKYSIENMAAIGCVPKMIFQDLPYFLPNPLFGCPRCPSGECLVGEMVKVTFNSVEKVRHRGCLKCDQDRVLCPMQGAIYVLWRKPPRPVYLLETWCGSVGELEALDDWYDGRQLAGRLPFT